MNVIRVDHLWRFFSNFNNLHSLIILFFINAGNIFDPISLCLLLNKLVVSPLQIMTITLTKLIIKSQRLIGVDIHFRCILLIGNSIFCRIMAILSMIFLHILIVRLRLIACDEINSNYYIQKKNEKKIQTDHEQIRCWGFS